MADRYPFVPAHGQTDTSALAAASLDSVTARIQRAVLFAIGEVGARGLTSHELAVRLGMERTTVQPRTSELKEMGLICDSGIRRPNPNGKRAIAWIRKGVGNV